MNMIQALQNENPEDAIHGTAYALGHLILFHSAHGFLSEEQARVMWPEIKKDFEAFTIDQFKKWEQKNLN